MGLLSKGTPLRWEEAKNHADHVRYHGISQFLALYKNLKGRSKDYLLWGDEVEYSLLKFDHVNKTVKLDLEGLKIVEDLIKEEEQGIPSSCLWRPEFARYMLEGTPSQPYGYSIKDFLSVEQNMIARRKIIKERLKDDQCLIALTAFPLLGTPNFLSPHFEPNGEYSHSLFIPDEAINTHPRFSTLTRNIRERRGRKVAINVPIFHDTKTPKPFIEEFPKSNFPEGAEDAKPDHIYMDCMCFGMGLSCLQVTFQACNVDEGRRLYDQLAPLAPLMLSLTASAPIFRGYLADIDCRWQVISASVDDRTSEELGLEPLKNNRFVIPKSRYDSVNRYISTDKRLLPEYNDLPEVYDKDIYNRLINEGVDPLLSHHVAHLFIRDPLVIYQELLNQDDENSSDHFENLQSTNWQTIRFKPPPPRSSIGWRVEFRSMEVQLTDFENAAYVIFIVLVTRTILSLDLNLYMPLSKVDENMKKAHRPNSAVKEKFFFRKNILDPDASNDCEEMSTNTIFNGDDEFPGLIPLVRSYLDTMSLDFETRCNTGKYLDLISQRASGKLMTAATWMRKFVREHPSYQFDSKVNQDISYDLLKTCTDITSGKVKCPELLGNFRVQAED